MENTLNLKEDQTSTAAKFFDPYDEVALLSCYECLVEALEASVNDETRFAYLIAGFWQMTSPVDFPGVGQTILVLIDNLLDTPEHRKDILPGLRLLVKAALADAEKRLRAQEKEYAEKYSVA